MVIEAPEKNAVHWMSPTDASQEIVLDDKKVGDFSHPSGPQAAFVSGSIVHLMIDTPTDVLHALISVAGNDDEIAQRY